MCDSQSTRGFSYMNEETIDVDVKCPICMDPFIEPVIISPCKHRFCRSGIAKILTNTPVCPICRYEPVTLSDLHPLDNSVVPYLNELLVKCDTCDQIDIQRYHFDEHIKISCPKVNLACSAVDLKCPWTGFRHQFNDHVKQCTFEHMRPVLGPLLQIPGQMEQIMNNNKELRLQINGLQHRCQQLEMRINESYLVPLRTAEIDINAKWIASGLTIAGGNGPGNDSNQLANPQGIYLHDDRILYIADFSNHRIMEWTLGETSGKVVAGGNGRGNADDQLCNPSDVIVDTESNSLIICDRENRRIVRWSLKDSTHGETIISNIDCNCLTMDANKNLYISDIDKNEVRQWRLGENESVVVAGGNGRGNRLDQLDYPSFVFVDRDFSVYVSDYNNNRVMKWTINAKEGIVVAGNQGPGDSLRHSYYPGGVIVDQWGSVYVADSEVHRVTCWKKGAIQGQVIVGGQGEGARSNQVNRPSGLLFDKQGNLFVANFNNHRIQKFQITTNDSE